MSITNLPENNTEGWKAELVLGFASRPHKTVLASRRQRGPLAVQRPFYPDGDVCHAYVLHPPGGVVGGDQLKLEANVEEDASALLTTPGATKFYRSGERHAIQHQHFFVTGGNLEWLPQENIFFPGADCSLTTSIHLSDNAHYTGWEIHCLGRPAISETFDSGKLVFKTAVYKEQHPLFIDRMVIEGGIDLDGAAGLRGHPVIATMIATPSNEEATTLARSVCEKDLVAGCAGVTLINDVLVVRYLGSSTAEAHRLLRSIWLTIRPIIHGRKAVPPRIWAT